MGCSKTRGPNTWRQTHSSARVGELESGNRGSATPAELRSAGGGRMRPPPRGLDGWLIFENDVGQSLLGGVGERESDVFGAELGCNGRRFTVKLNGRTLAFWPHHFDIAPADAVTPSRAERLHPGFLGGEARGIAFKAAGFSFAVPHFALGEDAVEKAIAKALDAFADARNFGDVNSGAEDHRNIVKRQFGFGNSER